MDKKARRALALTVGLFIGIFGNIEVSNGAGLCECTQSLDGPIWGFQIMWKGKITFLPQNSKNDCLKAVKSMEHDFPSNCVEVD